MNTEPFDESLLTAYLDGELSPTEIEWVEQAMAASPRLRQSYEELKCLRRWIVSAMSHASPIPTVEDQSTAETMLTAETKSPSTLKEAERDPAATATALQWPWLLDEAALHADPSSAPHHQSHRIDSAAHSDRQSDRHSARSRMGWTAFAALAATFLIVLLGGGLPSPLRKPLSFALPKHQDTNSSPSQEREQPPVDPIVQSAPIDGVLEDLRVREVVPPAPQPKALDPGQAQSEIASAMSDADFKQVEGTRFYAWAIPEGRATEGLGESLPNSGDASHGTKSREHMRQPSDANQSGFPQVAWSDAAQWDRDEIRLMEKVSPNDDTDALHRFQLSQSEPVQRTSQATMPSHEVLAFDKKSNSEATRRYDPRSLIEDAPPKLVHQPVEIPEVSSSFVDWLEDQMERAAHAPPPTTRPSIAADGKSHSDLEASIQLDRTLGRDGERDAKLLEPTVLDAEPRQPATPAADQANADADADDRDRVATAALERQVARGSSRKQANSPDTLGVLPAGNADDEDEVSLERGINDPGNRPSDSESAVQIVPPSAGSQRFRFLFRSTADRPFTRDAVAMPSEMEWESTTERDSDNSRTMRIEPTTSWSFSEPMSNATVAPPTPVPSDALWNMAPDNSSDSTSSHLVVPPTIGRRNSVEPPSLLEDAGTKPIYALEFVFKADQTAAALTSLQGLGIRWEAPGDWPSQPVVLRTRLSESNSDRLATILHPISDSQSSQQSWMQWNAPRIDADPQLQSSDPRPAKSSESESAAILRSVWLILLPTQAAVSEAVQR